MHAQDSALLPFGKLPGLRVQRVLRTLSLFLGIVLGLPHHATAQTVPSITSISPSSITAGGPTFTLTVNGSGYLAANSVVQVNGSNRPTVFKSAIQLTATIFATDIASPATLQITVFNPLATAPNGGFTSNAAPLAVGAAAVPVLISASPEFATQGGERLRMTLVGANFRPGATVVISPPLASVGVSNGHTPAGDVYVLSSTVVNGGLMTAIVSLSPAATLGLRAVDVLNLDGTSTGTSVNGGPGTSQPVRVQASNSLGAPLSVLNLALTHPRDGTVVMQGQELNAEAIVAGTGTGTVIGEWVLGWKCGGAVFGGNRRRSEHENRHAPVAADMVSGRAHVATADDAAQSGGCSADCGGSESGRLAAGATDSAGLRGCVCSRRRAAIVVGSGAGSGQISGGILDPAVCVEHSQLV